MFDAFRLPLVWIFDIFLQHTNSRGEISNTNKYLIGRNFRGSKLSKVCTFLGSSWITRVIVILKLTAKYWSKKFFIPAKAHTLEKFSQRKFIPRLYLRMFVPVCCDLISFVWALCVILYIFIFYFITLGNQHYVVA